MATDSASPHGRSDADLIASVRAGRIEEYGALYERHVKAATRLARQWYPMDRVTADEVVAEAFATVLDTLREGKGPDSAFRVYLLSTVRATAADRVRGAKPIGGATLSPTPAESERTSPTGYETSFPPSAVPSTPSSASPASPQASPDLAFGDREHLERSLIARAFSRLPERWQAVLWHTVIEQESPSDIAPLLGLSPNTVSALAYRAREALRQECLRAHLAETSAHRCRATASKLGVWARDGLSLRERAQVEQHLDHCARCRALADELADVNASLRGVVALLVLGGAAFGYLAATGGVASAVTTGSPAAVTGPRHFLGVAVSGVALATAIAVALTAGGVNGAPVAQQSPEPTHEQQPPTTSPPSAPSVSPSPSTELPSPQPSLPALPVPRPEAGSYQPPKASEPIPPPPLPHPPSDGADTEEPRRPPTTPPPSGGVGDDMLPPSPRLTASAPRDGVTLDAGGEAAGLDITVRNDGDAVAEGITVELRLPDGVTAVDAPDDGDDGDDEDGGDDGQDDDDAGAEDGAEDSGTPDEDGTEDGVTQLAAETATGPADGTARSGSPARARTGSGTATADEGTAGKEVTCPAGEGTVTCVVTDPLEPDESALLRFRVAASSTASSGAAVGTVTAADTDPAHFTVPITVNRDAADLDVSSAGEYLLVKLRNEGVRQADATVTLTVPARLLTTHRLECETGSDDDPLRCESRRPLAPGGTARLWLRLPHSHDGAVTVIGTVGDATVTETVEPNPSLPDLPGPVLPGAPDAETPPPEPTRPTEDPASTPAATTPEDPADTITVTPTPSPTSQKHAWSPLAELRKWFSRRAGRRIRPRQAT